MIAARAGRVCAALLLPLTVVLAGCSSGSTATVSGSHTTSPTSAGSQAAVGSASPAPAGSSSCPAAGSSGTVTVNSAGALQSALDHPRPGEAIVMAPGTYAGSFTVSQSGTQAAPLTLCGPRSAVLDGGAITKGYTLYLDHASWWRIEGFTVEGGQKGVVTDGSDHDLIDGLYVHSVGDEGIHLRAFSSYDIVRNSLVRDTGQAKSFYGEGIYVGSAHKNWCRYSDCQPDASNDDLIEGNNIADTTAENIDIKEGTTGGQIVGNTFDGAGMVASAATAWVNVKGNDWAVVGNTGVDSIKDGFQVHKVYHGWGMDNVFRDNKAEVNGPGNGFYVQSKHLQTIVYCNNEVVSAGAGFSTIACTS